MNVTDTEKLYSPLEFYLHNPREEEESGEYGFYDLYDERYKISCFEASEHTNAIDLSIHRDRDRMDQKRGMAEYLDSSLGTKVVSLFPEVENYGDMMVCAAKLTLSEPLTPEEKKELKDWWSGQLSDGWGEGLAQREIKIGNEELYIVPWTSGDDFFLDYEQEFLHRIGLDVQEQQQTPAQAAIFEPDATEDIPTAVMRAQLIDRLNVNLADYFNTLSGMDGKEIASFSSEIAAITEAHYYLTEIHNFHTSEAEYLLKFQNPLEVVADAFDAAGVDNKSDIMWKIFDHQDALQGDYALITEVPDAEPDTEVGEKLHSMKSELSSRLITNLSDYCESVMENGKRDIVGMAEEIATRFAVREYFMHRHNFDIPQLEFLLRYDDPLEVVADYCPALRDLIAKSGALRDICSLESALQKEYPLAGQTARHQLFDRLDKNLEDTVTKLQEDIARNVGKPQVAIDLAREISMVGSAHEFLAEQPFSMDDAKLLLQYDDPLSLFSARWEPVMAGSKYSEDMVHAVLADIKKGAERARGTEPAAKCTHETGGNEKPSVLAQIRDATKAPKELRSDKPAKNKSEPEH